MTQRIEFTNRPPTPAQCPAFNMKMFARALNAATLAYKQQREQQGAARTEGGAQT